MPKDNIPEIRVAGFSEVQWSKKKCEDLLTERNVQHPQSEEYPLVSFTIEDGVTPKTERYERESLVAGDKNAKKYKETRLNDIVYNPANLKFGAIARNKYGNAVFSPIYVTFDVNENFAVPEFVEVLVSKKDFIQDALQYQKGTVYERMSVCSTDFLNLDVKIPSVAEQRQIGSIFERLDALISQHQHKHEALVAVKKAMLEKMFPKEGENVPEIRFSGFSEPWAQRKVREVTDRYDNLRIPVAASLRIAGTTPYYGANGIQDYVEGYTHDGEFILVAEDGASDLKNYPVKCVKGRIWVNNHAHVLQGKCACADNQFLAYAISQADIESLLVGGGRAKLNAETLMDIELLLPSKDEQTQIGTYFRSLDNLITLHQRKCEVLKNLKSALLSKMFV